MTNWQDEFDKKWGRYLGSIIGVTGDITDKSSKAIEFDIEIKNFIQQTIDKAVKEAFKKGYIKGALDGEYGQVLSEEILTKMK